MMRVQGLAGFKGVGVYDSCENDLLSNYIKLKVKIQSL